MLGAVLSSKQDLQIFLFSLASTHTYFDEVGKSLKAWLLGIFSFQKPNKSKKEIQLMTSDLGEVSMT